MAIQQMQKTALIIKLRDSAKRLKDENKLNKKTASNIAYLCRFKLGLNYNQTFKSIADEIGLTRPEWDELLQD